MQQLKVMMRWHSCGSFAQFQVVLSPDQSRGESKDGFMTDLKTQLRGLTKASKWQDRPYM